MIVIYSGSFIVSSHLAGYLFGGYQGGRGSGPSFSVANELTTLSPGGMLSFYLVHTYSMGTLSRGRGASGGSLMVFSTFFESQAYQLGHYYGSQCFHSPAFSCGDGPVESSLGGT